MQYPRTLCITLLACAAFFFAGCIDFSEDFFFNADGTGRMIIDIAVSSELLSMGSQADSSAKGNSEEAKSKARMVKQFSANPKVANVAIRDTAFGGMQHTVFQVDVKSFNDLPEIHKAFFADSEMSASGSMGPGKPDIGMQSQTSPSGNTTVQLDFILPRDTATADTGAAGAAIGESIANAMMGNSSFNFRVHGPKITAANGDIDSAAHTVEWKIPLTGMKHSAGKTLHAEISIPGAPQSNTFVRQALVAGITAAAAAAAAVMWRRRSKKAV